MPTGELTNDYLNEGTIVAEKKGSNIIRYLFDENGGRFGFEYNGAKYYYAFNGQGDVIGITDPRNRLAVSYTYDSWGKLVSTGGDSPALAAANPIRYRGYYYDSESGLYYLNSRYYDPETGRFINADEQLNPDILGNNLFAYCENNPITHSDSTGRWLGLDDLIAGAVGAVVGVAGQFVGDVVTSAINNKWQFSNWQTYTGAAIGGAVGGITTLYAGPIVGAAVGSGTSTLVGQTLENITPGGTKRSVGEIAVNTVVDAGIGAVVGAIIPVEVPGITVGRNSMAAVYKSGLTKIAHQTARRMSGKVVAKGIWSGIVSNIAICAAIGFKAAVEECRQMSK